MTVKECFRLGVVDFIERPFNYEVVNDRVYKKAFPRDVAYNMIRNGECGEFSPKLMVSFERCIDTMNNTVH